MEVQHDVREEPTISMLVGVWRIEEIIKEVELSSEKAVDEMKESILSLVTSLKERERHLALLIDKRRMRMGSILRQMKEELQRGDELLKEISLVDETCTDVEEEEEANVKELGSLAGLMILDIERMREINRMSVEAEIEVSNVLEAIRSGVSELTDDYPFKAEPSSLTSFRACLGNIMERRQVSKEMKIQKHVEKKRDVESTVGENRSCDDDKKCEGSDISQWLLTTKEEESTQSIIHCEDASHSQPSNKKEEDNNMSQWLYRPELCESSNSVMQTGMPADNLALAQGYMETRKQDEMCTGLENLHVEETRDSWKDYEEADITKWLLRPKLDDYTGSTAFLNDSVTQTSNWMQDNNNMSQWLYVHRPAPADSKEESPARLRTVSFESGSSHNPNMDWKILQCNDQSQWLRESGTFQGTSSPAISVRMALETHMATPKEMWLRPALCESSYSVIQTGMTADNVASAQGYMETRKQDEMCTGLENLHVDETRDSWKEYEEADITKWLLRPKLDDYTGSTAFLNANVTQTSNWMQDNNNMSQWLYVHRPAPADSKEESPARLRTVSFESGSSHNPNMDWKILQCNDQSQWLRESGTFQGTSSPATSVRMALETHKATPKEMWLRQKTLGDNVVVDMNSCVRHTDEAEQLTRLEDVRSNDKKEDYEKWLIQGSKSYLNTANQDYKKWLATDSGQNESLFFPCNRQYNRKAFRKLMKHLCQTSVPRFDSVHLCGHEQSSVKAEITTKHELALSAHADEDDITKWLLPNSRGLESVNGNKSVCSGLDFQESSAASHLEEASKPVTSLSDSISRNCNNQTYKVKQACCDDVECDEFEVIDAENGEEATEFD